MRAVQWLSPEQAVALIPSGAVMATGGFVGCGHPEALTRALGERFLREGSPRDLTLIYAAGQGDGCSRGLNHIAHAGLLRRIIGGHWNLAPQLGRLARSGDVEAYSLPQGVISRMYRECAAGNPGLLSRVGLRTFVDPRHGGGRMNAATREDIVEFLHIAGEDVLLYRTPEITVGLIRATSADSFGGLSFEREANVGEALSIAQAVRSRRGLVIAQVERRVPDFSRDPKAVRVPGVFVDAVVLADPTEHAQTFGDPYCEDFVNQGPVSELHLGSLPAGPRRWIASRALDEIADGDIVNLGIGLPESIAQLACERQVLDRMTLTLEVGVIGGVPAGGLSFGASRLPMSVIDQPYMFDFYDGGGLDVAFLSMAECDAEGNVNVSSFGGRVPGPGGFINIAQSTRKVVFLGTFTAGGLDCGFEDGCLRIRTEGRSTKFVRRVEQVTFSAAEAIRRGHSILYVTERAVFRLTAKGPELMEVAPGLSAEQVVAAMHFRPVISPVLTGMNPSHFK